MATTAQESYDVFIGSGALEHMWYSEIVDETPATIGDDWEVSFIEFGANDPKIRYTLDHKSVMRAVRRIAGKDGPAVSQYTRKQCLALVFKGADEVDFDAGAADEVLQIAAFGEVING